MVHAVKNAVKKGLYVAGYYHLCRQLASSRQKRLLILMYHHLTQDLPPANRRMMDDGSPNSSQFEAHLRELARRYRVVSLKNVITSIRTRGVLDSDSVAITFDDGFESCYRIAYPLLRKYNLPATVFLVTDWVGQDVLPWWHRLRDMIDLADMPETKSDEIRSLLGTHAPLFRRDHESLPGRQIRLNNSLTISLREMDANLRTAKLEALEHILFPTGSFSPVPARMLSWDQIREMANFKIDFESHTQSHINLPFTDPSIVEKEIRQSKAEIEAKIQREVTGFAYPYGQDIGSYVRFEQLLHSQGFAYACNARLGHNTSASNLFSLHRCGLPHTDSTALINREILRRFQRSD